MRYDHDNMIKDKILQFKINDYAKLTLTSLHLGAEAESSREDGEDNANLEKHGVHFGKSSSDCQRCVPLVSKLEVVNSNACSLLDTPRHTPHTHADFETSVWPSHVFFFLCF